MDHLPTVVWDRQIRNYREQCTLLWSIVKKYTGNPELINLASLIIKDKDVPENDSVALIKAIQEYVQKTIKFFREYPERWQSPLRTLEWKIGDCDDQAILLASVLRSFRIPVRFKFVRFLDPKERKRKSHVYTQVKVNGNWYSAETVKPVHLGFDPEKAMRERGIKILGVDYIGDK